ncbi:hypothetical protein ACFQ4O_12530 [Methylopila musalis]|uniref:Uncharacterized protein n=1 Tax=Methylopila musalis TaxID=1134781 RepID=A0ABW3ZA18_9HYPH
MPRMTTPQQGGAHTDTDAGQMAGWRPADAETRSERGSASAETAGDLRRVTAPLSLRARRR